MEMEVFDATVLQLSSVQETAPPWPRARFAVAASFWQRRERDGVFCFVLRQAPQVHQGPGAQGKIRLGDCAMIASAILASFTLLFMPTNGNMSVVEGLSAEACDQALHFASFGVTREQYQAEIRRLRQQTPNAPVVVNSRGLGVCVVDPNGRPNNPNAAAPMSATITIPTQIK
jgi:hypothetical protein